MGLFDKSESCGIDYRRITSPGVPVSFGDFHWCIMALLDTKTHSRFPEALSHGGRPVPPTEAESSVTRDGCLSFGATWLCSPGVGAIVSARLPYRPCFLPCDSSLKEAICANLLRYAWQ